ncbi:McbB family protein [Kurthia sibirica]|uniref:McbB family protein n=1 Tax=Kurthia sibirica TaxID=202750 RepID=A0A2U3AEZ8_9BACL|nr:McbB family protein [Kurthia sibirica]PWI23021.1 McbB family protein [Kurthia sibirica]GEK35598.1 hypothetical protein KSI01_31310 [Kurthia sibirica]
MYKINPYLLYNTKDNHNIIQTKENSLILNSQPLIDFLKFLEVNNIDIISMNEIKNFFDNEEEFSEKIVDFLCKNEIFKENIQKKISFESINIISNENIGHIFSKFLKVKNSYTVQELLNKKKILEDDCLTLIILNPFNLNHLKEILEVIRNYENLICKVVFPYNNSIYISNYYSKKWNNPCPICFISSLEAQLRGNINGDLTWNFQMIMDLIYEEKLEFEYDGLLEEKDYIPVINILLRDMLNNKLSSNIDKVYKISLRDYFIDTDIAYYWEVCDCYE